MFNWRRFRGYTTPACIWYSIYSIHGFSSFVPTMGPFPNTFFFLTLSWFAGASVAQQNLGTINITFPERPPNAALTNPVNDNFLGISWELSSLDTLCKFPSVSYNCVRFCLGFMLLCTPLKIRLLHRGGVFHVLAPYLIYSSYSCGGGRFCHMWMRYKPLIYYSDAREQYHTATSRPVVFP